MVLCAVFPTADTNRTPSETVAIENMEVGKERPGYPTKIGFPCFFLLATSLSTTPELLYTLSSSSFFRPQDGLGSAPLYDILLLRYLELSRINLS